MPFPLSILSFLSFLSVIPPPPRSTLFPYTTLFRSVVYDFVNVIQGEATLNQALIRDKQLENLFILPASQTRDKDALTRDGVGKVLQELKEMEFEYIICDSPAGIETGALMASYLDRKSVV